MKKFLKNHRGACIAISWLLVFGLFSYPPVQSYSQQRTDTITRDTLSDYRRSYIRSLEQSNKQKEDSIRADFKFIKKHSDVDLSNKEPKVIVKYKTKIKRVEVPVIIHDTLIQYIPVSKSELFLTSKAYNDSLREAQHVKDSLQAERQWELKHRSIFKKIFGSKPHRK